MNWKKIYTQQVDESDCGVAALSMILKYFGSYIPLATLRYHAKTTIEGTSIYGIKKAATIYNLNGAAIRISKETLTTKELKDNLPMIVHVVKDTQLLHYYVLLEVTDNKVLLADPDGNVGINSMSKSNFFKEWDGIALLLKPTKKYQKIRVQQPGLFSYRSLLRKHKKLIILITCSAILAMLIQIMGSFLFQIIIDKILPQKNLKILEIVSIGLITSYVIGNLAQFLNNYALSILGQKLSKIITIDYLTHIFKLPMDFFQTRKKGEIISRFSDSSKIVDAIASTYVGSILDIILFFSILIVLFTQNIVLTATILLILPIYAIIVISFIKPFEDSQRKYMERNSQISSIIIDALSGIETIKSLNWESDKLNKIIHQYEELLRANLKYTKLDFIQQNIITCLDSILSVVILSIGAIQVNNDQILLGQLVTFNALAVYLTTPLQNIIRLQPKIHAASIATKRLSEIYSVMTEDSYLKKDNHFTSDNALNSLFSLANVSVNYNFTKKVIHDINLEIRKNEHIVLAGESGSGKSTLAKVLVKFIPYDSGKVEYCGKSLNCIPSAELRQKVIYLPQTPMIFSDTLLYNLIGSKKLKDVNMEQFKKICEITGVDTIIQNLSQGILTVLEENGNNLSGGQKQRICLARALLSKPEVLILDESTSNLDQRAEVSIMTELFKENRTLLVIAHRLQVSEIADRVIVLKNGIISETGTFTNLNHPGTYFFDLLNTQFETKNTKKRTKK